MKQGARDRSLWPHREGAAGRGSNPRSNAHRADSAWTQRHGAGRGSGGRGAWLDSDGREGFVFGPGERLLRRQGTAPPSGDSDGRRFRLAGQSMCAEGRSLGAGAARGWDAARTDA
jgi:hypothetical protein